MPLYDLEERTYELWEQAGFPTSSLNGFSLTVSADATPAQFTANSNIFSTLSACLAALPKVIRFPVLIEVANFGDLGKLELNDVEMTESGSIEIINRNYGRIYSASSQVQTVTGFNGHSLISQVSSLDLSVTMTNASALGISSLVYSGAADVRLSAVNVVVLPAPNLRQGHLTVGIGISNFRSGVANIFNTTPYDASLSSAGGDNTVSGYDIIPVNQTDPTKTLYRIQSAAGNAVVGSFYGNKLSKISIKNCNGPIYVRNFFVDGGAHPHTNVDGILIENSNTVLENCIATRFEKAGWSVRNSKVVLSRSAFAWRNYDLTSAVARLAQDETAGFKFINSEITFSGNTTQTDTQATPRDFIICAARNSNGIVLDNSQLIGGLDRVTITSEQTKSHIQSEHNTVAGILAMASRIQVQGLLDLYGNKCGTDITNSKLIVNELCIDSSQNEGIKALNSKIIYGSWLTSGTEVAANRWQTDLSGNGQAVVLDGNSELLFNEVDSVTNKMGSFAVRNSHGYQETAKHALPAIEVKNGSKARLIHPFISRINSESLVDNMIGFGVGLAAKNGSEINCFGSFNHPTIIYGPTTVERNYFLAGAYAKNGSLVSFHGPTVILNFGVDTFVEDSSEVLFSPPYKDGRGAFDDKTFALSSAHNHTSVELHSTRACLVADGNSVINIENLGHHGRFWKNTANGVVALGIADDLVNNTAISSICAQGSMQFYPNPNDRTTLAATGTGENGATLVGTLTPNSKFTSGVATNYLLANNDISAGAINWANIESITSGGVCIRALNNSIVNVRDVHFPIGSTSGPTDGLYYNVRGNDCYRLMIWNIADKSRLNASYCSVSGMYPADVGYHGPSAIYMSSVNGVANINVVARGAPNGTPDTGSLSILDTFGAGSAVWVVPSGVGVNDPFNRFFPMQASNAGLFNQIAGAGLNAQSIATNFYGASGNRFNNQGVFRIYFSPHSSAKFLLVNASGYYTGNNPGVPFSGTNIAYQIYAQGYNMSGPCKTMVTADGIELSSLFPNLLKMSFDGNSDGFGDNLAMSGFYYCSEFVEEDPTQCMLDESASNTFANAKNASYGRSGRPKKVTIYRASISDPAGENREGGSAVGFKSANVFDLRRYS